MATLLPIRTVGVQVTFLNLFQVWHFVLNFHKLLISQKAFTKLPRKPSPKNQPQAKSTSTFIKNFLAF
jgi:hypothetical protein